MNEAELSKAEQELVEKIAQREAELHRVYYNRKYGYHPWDKLPPTLKAEIYEKADYFISLFNEALPELAKANGYVKLDID